MTAWDGNGTWSVTWMHGQQAVPAGALSWTLRSGAAPPAHAMPGPGERRRAQAPGRRGRPTGRHDPRTRVPPAGAAARPSASDGSHTVTALHENARFVRVSEAGWRASEPHNVEVD